MALKQEGRVFSAGPPSTRDPVCLTAELVLLKGCLKGPEPETLPVMFVWLSEEQHPKSRTGKRNGSNGHAAK